MDYDESDIDRIAAEAAEAVEDAAIGRGSWQCVTDVIARGFPGCFAGVLNTDFVEGRVKFAEVANIDPDFVKSYTEHYVQVNRWADFWRYIPSGGVFVSERDMPASTLTDSEFYNDWLKPQDLSGSVGLKVDAGPRDLITVPIQYPLRYAAAYDRPTAMVAARLHGALLRAVEFARFSRDEFEAATARCALATRGRPAVVVDASMNLIEANEEAQEMIVHARLLRHRNGRLSFANRQLDDLISGLVRDLCRSPYAPVFERRWNSDGIPWVFRAVRVPGSGSMAGNILPARDRIMLLMQNLLTPRHSAGDLAGFADLFRLTPAETRLCAALTGGLGLADAAVRAGIAHETARSQIKAIFTKTGARGQPDLRVLLERYLAG